MATTSQPSQPIRMDRHGRIVVPTTMREAMGLEAGTRLVAKVVDGELRITTFRRNLKRIQREIRSEIPDRNDVMAEFFADRRRDAALEDSDG